MRLFLAVLAIVLSAPVLAAAAPSNITFSQASSWRVVTQGFDKLSCVYQRDQSKSNFLAKSTRLKNGSVRARVLSAKEIKAQSKATRARCQRLTQPDPTGCTAIAKDSIVKAAASQEISIPLEFSGTCPNKPLVTISDRPTLGSIVELKGTTVVYLPKAASGEDSFTFTVQPVWPRTRSTKRNEVVAPKSKGKVKIRIASPSVIDPGKNCTPALAATSLTLSAFGQADLNIDSALSVPLGCDKADMRIVQKTTPTLGQIQWAAHTLTFLATNFQGTENIMLSACYGQTDFCSEDAPLVITVSTAAACVPSARPASLSIAENSSVALELGEASSCSGFSTYYEITLPASRGQTSITGNQALYTTSFGSGTDSFEYRSCLSPSNLCGTPARVNVSIAAGVFTGRPVSLSGYKDNISLEEAAYLLKKVAFGGCDNLLNISQQQGLRAMVNTMLDSANGGCTYSLPVSGDAGNQDVNKFAYRMYHPAAGGNEFQHWERGVYQTLLTVARYGPPLREYMTWIVMNNKLATNSYVPWSIVPKHHYNILSRNALGNFGDFFREFYGKMPVPPVPSQQTTPGVDPSLAKNPDYYQLNGEGIYDYGGSNAAYGDVAHQLFLGNQFNTIEGPNENLGRELLELYTMGALDPITGRLNYTQADVRASTNAVAGYHYRSKNPNGTWRRFLGWFPDRSLSGINTAITIFNGTPWAKTSIFQPNYEGNDTTNANYIPYLLNEVPATSRGVGSRMFTELVHPNLNENLVNQLAGKLLTYYPSPNVWLGRMGNENYSIKELLRGLLTSEAMFSPDAVGRGVHSPMEVLVGMMRTLNLPMKVFHTSLAFRDVLIEAQQVPLQPPTVFGWPNYGVNRQGIVLNGSDWLNVSPLLGTFRGIIRLLNQVFLIVHESQNPYAFMPNGTQTSANQLVDSMIQLFRFSRTSSVPGAKFSDLERQILIEYVQDSATAPGSWNPSNVDVVRKKVGGLMVLLATHPQFLRK